MKISLIVLDDIMISCTLVFIVLPRLACLLKMKATEFCSELFQPNLTKAGERMYVMSSAYVCFEQLPYFFE